MKTRIIIIDDHPFIRKGIITYLCKENDLDIIGEADSGEAALQLARSLSPDIVLLDLILTDMSGDRVIKEIKKNYPYIKTIVICCISESTVRSHIHHLKAKRGIRSRQKLMLYALQEGLN